MQNVNFEKINEINTQSINDIENMLDNDIDINKKERWNKLDKTIKYNKLVEFSKYYEVDEIKREQLIDLLTVSLNDNKFSKISDVVYEDNKIASIPSLICVDDKYYIRHQKRHSTSKSLPSKTLKTRRNKKQE